MPTLVDHVSQAGGNLEASVSKMIRSSIIYSMNQQKSKITE